MLQIYDLELPADRENCGAPGRFSSADKRIEEGEGMLSGRKVGLSVQSLPEWMVNRVNVDSICGVLSSCHVTG